MMLLLLCWFIPCAEPPLQAVLVADQLRSPFAVAFDASHRLWFVEYQGHRLGMLNDKQQPIYHAGTGTRGHENGLPGSLNSPHNLAIAPDGIIYLADTFNHTVRKYDPVAKQLSTLAGTGKPGYDGDVGLAGPALFNETYHVTLDATGKVLYVVDLKNQRIRRIDLAMGVVTTVAGNGKKGSPIDGGDAMKSPLNDPRALIVDAQGQLYLLQRGGNDLWMINQQGKLHRLAGTGKKDYSGDGGPALQATLNGPKHLCFDQHGDILIADTDNHCIRRVQLKSGLIDLVAGRGTGTTLPGRATSIRLKEPHGVSCQPGTNDIYIADSGYNRIIKLVATRP